MKSFVRIGGAAVDNMSQSLARRGLIVDSAMRVPVLECSPLLPLLIAYRRWAKIVLDGSCFYARTRVNLERSLFFTDFPRAEDIERWKDLAEQARAIEDEQTNVDGARGIILEVCTRLRGWAVHILRSAADRQQTQFQLEGVVTSLERVGDLVAAIGAPNSDSIRARERGVLKYKGDAS